jgi:hypothetical protein
VNMEPLEHPSDMVPGCAKVEYLYHVVGSRPCLHYFCKQVGEPPNDVNFIDHLLYYWGW